MNLFWKKLFRTLQPTLVFEKKMDKVKYSMDSSESSSLSDDQYNREYLQHYVNSAEFKKKKADFQTRKYKDTDEFRIMRQYEKLLNDTNIRLYYETKNSKLLKEYSDFKSSPDSLNLKELSILEVSEKINSLKEFEQSKEYRNYTQYHDSLAVREFEELKKKIAESEFQYANAFWANPHRWELTREFEMEQRYAEIMGEAVQKKKSKNKLRLFKNYESVKLTFVENFDWSRLEESRWSAGFHSSNPRLIGNYSFVNEQQANSCGRNVSTSNGVLTLRTVHLPARALAWDIQKGFVEKDFAYTSDVIQTAAVFKQKYGVFSAKLRCSGNIHHALWLSGVRKLPHINIFYYNGSSITVGNANQHKVDGVEISGITPTQFFIYTLEWTPKELIWYVNNVEVFRTNDNIPHESLYVGINSFIPNRALPEDGLLEVDWIRVYK